MKNIANNRKIKIFIIVVTAILLTSALFLIKIYTKTSYDEFVDLYDDAMAKIMKAIDIDNIKETLLAQENIQRIELLKKEFVSIEEKVPKDKKTEYLFMKNRFLELEKAKSQVEKWDSLKIFHQIQILDYLLRHQVMYD